MAEAGYALATDAGVGVFHGGDDAGDSGGDQRVGAGTGSALVAAGFQRHVGGGAVGPGAGFVKGNDLGVVQGAIYMMSATDDFAAADKDATDGGVGAGSAGAEAGQRQGFVHEWRFQGFIVTDSCRGGGELRVLAQIGSGGFDAPLRIGPISRAAGAAERLQEYP